MRMSRQKSCQADASAKKRRTAGEENCSEMGALGEGRPHQPLV
jgi:hypothetical protein